MDHYAVLGLRPGAPIEEIRLQFRRLAMVFHPDRNRDDAWCQEQLKRLNASYEFLSDAGRKARYDALLAGRGEGRSGPGADIEGGRERTPAYSLNTTGVSPSASSRARQRLFLSALFCVAVIGSVVIGILIGAGQTLDDPLWDPGSAFVSPAAQFTPAATGAPMSGGSGPDVSGPANEGPLWPSSLSGTGAQGVGEQTGTGGLYPPLSTSPARQEGWPQTARGYDAPPGP